MEVTKPSYEILTPISSGGEEELRRIEEIARTCYKSESKSDISDTARFIDGLIRRGHLAMLEHGSLSVRFVTDRCISHEMVRHRMASFAQESTRWCNYANGRFGGQITIVEPDFSDADDPFAAMIHFEAAVKYAEETYLYLINTQHLSAQKARRILPHCLKTEIVITANYREWMHIFELRCAKDCDPEISKLMTALLTDLRERLPIIFDRCALYLYNERVNDVAEP